MMRKFRSLMPQLLALAVLADAFALGREKTIRITDSSDTEQDLTPAGSAAQHITKIPRSKAKVQNKTTEKPIATTTTTTTTVEDDDDKTKEPAEGVHEIEDKALESTTEVHGPGNDEARTAVASNGTNDDTQTANGTEVPIESTSVSVTNNEPKRKKEADDPNSIPKAVSEINSDINIDNATVSLTSVDSQTHYSTVSVNDNEHKSAIVSDHLEEMPHERRELTSVNVTETHNSVNALVAEFTQANRMSLGTTEESFMPHKGPISNDKSIHEVSTQGSELKLTDTKKIQEEPTLQPELLNYTSSDNSNKSRLTEWLRRADSELATESKATTDLKYDKVISKEERASDFSTTNYGDKLETTSHEPVEFKSPSDIKENEGPLDDVTMDTSNTWRREDAAVVTSMRGGYLNHSPDAQKDASASRVVVQPDDENETTLTKNTQVASRNLMVDDQIKDELMEDQLTERVGRREERPLSVKPIIGKNSALYSVSPNYKPMKKLDVVPGKPQLRDPDDNSWRNQSLNNLGIVFKGNNSSKPFTQVLKNKTETDLSNLVEKEEKIEAPELRERLEKLAEERKSKKKKTDKSGENSEYDDASSYFYRTTTKGPARAGDASRGDAQKTSPFKNIFKAYDYESTDDDVEYVTLPFLDLQKSPTTKSPTRAPTTNWARPTTKQTTVRKATVQYFPPKVYMKNDTAEDDFQRKMQAFAPELDAPVSTANLVLRERDHTAAAERSNFYLPDTPKPVLTGPYNLPADKAYSFRDIMAKIGHEDDYDRVNEYVPLHKVKEVLTQPAPIRTEVIDKFMQNYNDNSKKFRVDYPVVYNSRVFHTGGSVEGPASSSASMKQQYSGPGKQLPERKKIDRNCDKVVELSADYDLHYFMPDQEERLEFGKVLK